MVAFSSSRPFALPARSDARPAFGRMRLVGGEGEEAAPFDPTPHCDRRAFPRREVSLKVHGRRLDHSVDARREPFLYLDMKDVSIGGIAATSQTAMKVGERVAVFFPPEGASQGWDAYGRVLRVEPARHGYRIAVRFDSLPAA